MHLGPQCLVFAQSQSLFAEDQQALWYIVVSSSGSAPCIYPLLGRSPMSCDGLCINWWREWRFVSDARNHTSLPSSAPLNPLGTIRSAMHWDYQRYRLSHSSRFSRALTKRGSPQGATNTVLRYVQETRPAGHSCRRWRAGVMYACQ